LRSLCRGTLDALLVLAFRIPSIGHEHAHRKKKRGHTDQQRHGFLCGKY
jgi:hypothetical protein